MPVLVLAARRCGASFSRYTANKRRGLGFGLAICDRIAKVYGGSQPNIGTFRIRLPIDGNGSDVSSAEQTE